MIKLKEIMNRSYDYHISRYKAPSEENVYLDIEREMIKTLRQLQMQR